MNKIKQYFIKRDIKRYSNTYIKSLYLQICRNNSLLPYEMRKLIISDCKRRGLI